MRLRYAMHVMDTLHRARPQADLAIRCGAGELRAHSTLLAAVSSLEAEAGPGARLALPPSSGGELACCSCTARLLDALYARDVGEPESGHEAHLESLLDYFKIVDFVRDFLYASMLNRFPKDRRLLAADKSEKSSDMTVRQSLKDGSAIEKIAKFDKSQSKSLSSKMLTCLECAYRCYKPAEMLTHIVKTRHGRNVCSLCSCRTESSKRFDEHLKKHDNEKPFFCTTCDARFQTRTLWSQHLPAHSSVAPFRCPHCTKSFKWKHGLNGHLITHTKEKKHLCDECGFSTTHAKTLRAHKLTHSGNMFRCTHSGCSHTSSRKENMKIHLKTHSKEKPFVCEICGLKFTQNKNLQRHSLIHSHNTMKKTLPCLHCSFTALRSDNLKAHMLRQHTEKPLNLELCDNFTDALSMSDEQCIEVKEEKKSDLTVLADAASSCPRIDDSIAKTEVKGELAKFRNFDNLIANPAPAEDDKEIVVSL